jgi:hypothetical protein
MSDPFFSNVSLLLHCDGVNGSTTFTDSSPSPKIVIAYGGATISTTHSKWGGASLLTGALGGHLSVPAHADFDFGTGDFTVEMWIRHTSLSFQGYAQSDQIGSSTSNKWWLGLESGNALTFGAHSTSLKVTSSWVPVLGQWYHIAATRDSGVCRLFIDGVLVATDGSVFNGYNFGQNQLTLAGMSTPFWLDGNLDDVRITKGVARYTASFTLPPEAFSNRGASGVFVNWLNKIITIPQADLIPLGGERYRLDVDAFRLALKNIEDGEEGMSFEETHRHSTAATLSGVTYARQVEIINGYTVTFESTGTPYQVECVGANHNIADVKNVNDVSLIVGNSAGLISVNTGGSSGPTAAEIWAYLLTSPVPGSAAEKLANALSTTNFLALK